VPHQPFYRNSYTGHTFTDASLFQSFEPAVEANPSVDADPFATPPRIISPQPEISVHEAVAPESPNNQERHEASDDGYPLLEPLIESAEHTERQPQMAEMPTLSAYHTLYSGFNNDTNPFLSSLRTRETGILPGSFPTGEDMEHSSPQKAQMAIDQCVAHLVEMGYGDNGDEIERLRIYAQMTGGNLEDSIEMLEEEKNAWERR